MVNMRAEKPMYEKDLDVISGFAEQLLGNQVGVDGSERWTVQDSLDGYDRQIGPSILAVNGQIFILDVEPDHAGERIFREILVEPIATPSGVLSILGISGRTTLDQDRTGTEFDMSRHVIKAAATRHGGQIFW